MLQTNIRNIYIKYSNMQACVKERDSHCAVWNCSKPKVKTSLFLIKTPQHLWPSAASFIRPRSFNLISMRKSHVTRALNSWHCYHVTHLKISFYGGCCYIDQRARPNTAKVHKPSTVKALEETNMKNPFADKVRGKMQHKPSWISCYIVSYLSAWKFFTYLVMSRVPIILKCQT